YAFLPLGLKILKKIENIVREEMNRTGAIEMLLPAIQPADLWIQSERWYEYGPEMFRLKDRNERDFCLGPTHEEIMTYLAYIDIKSYKELPINLYQIQVKFRDEIRPRYGLLRAREFIMKDAYSFSQNEEELDSIYDKMYECYSRILKRLNLRFNVIEADTGLIGGKFSHEFTIMAENGEDQLVRCNSCSYAANYNKAKFKTNKKNNTIEDPEEMEDTLEVWTPGITTIKSLVEFLKVPSDKIVKTMLLKDTDKNIFAVLISAEKELNISKFEKFVNKKLEILTEHGLAKNLHAGYLGPVGLDSSINIYADDSIKNKKNFITGANKENYHLINVNYPRDFNVVEFGDFAFPSEEDLCPLCEGKLIFEKGIEIGHIFKLGTKYSQKMDAKFLDNKGELRPFVMGCYGIGISRILSAAIEQLYDKNGIIWPISIAPFLVNIILTGMDDETLCSSAEKIHEDLKNAGIDVLFDDRDVRAGVKFKDSDLIGIPIKIILGRNFKKERKVDIELRKDGTQKSIFQDEIVNFVRNYLGNNNF
ncbi:MAG: proline--tRNA ligase, partial [Actinobacteria bacterium]|nr:proline--tRNA ligase [Actinomycetota bacterium]